MVHMRIMIISPGVFFNFKILIFLVDRGLKGQKKDQNDKNFCLSHHIFQGPYHMIFIYGTHVCIKGYLQTFFSFLFQDFDFWGH